MKIILSDDSLHEVPDEHYDFLSQIKWRPDCNNRLYAVATIRLHQLVAILIGLKIPEGMIIYHIDRDPTNNSKENLRVVTNSQNNHNKLLQSNNTSGVKGVSYHKGARKWQVRINVKGVQIQIGMFSKLEEAEKARKEAEIRYGIP